MRRHDSAGRQAREVVGLYGDPDTTWGICLELGFAVPLVTADVAARLEPLAAEYPHLGAAPNLEVVAGADWDRRREHLAATPYSADAPLVRVAMTPDGTRLLVAAHHGACDGLGLVAIGDRLSGAALLSRARGIGDRPAPLSFLRSSLARLQEAIWRPPPRFGSHRLASGPGERLQQLTVPRLSAGTVDLCLALGEVFVSWNRGKDAGESPLFVMGASRRPPGTLAPDRQTAYLRLRLDPAWDGEQARTAFRSLAPEPEFPETSVGGLGPRITRMLRNRLGATAQVSNLGVIEGSGLEYAAMFPALSGPRGLAVGLVSTGGSTTLSLRTRCSEFAPEDAAELLALTLEHLRRRVGSPAQ